MQRTITLASTHSGWARGVQVLKQLADAERELAEAVAAADEEAAGGGNAAADAAELEGDGSLDDFGFGAEAFAAAHLPVARATLGMLHAVVGMGKAVVRRLLSERYGSSWAGPICFTLRTRSLLRSWLRCAAACAAALSSELSTSARPSGHAPNVQAGAAGRGGRGLGVGAVPCQGDGATHR